jgi:hypothetical protein
LPLQGREGVTLTTTEDFPTTQKLRISPELKYKPFYFSVLTRFFGILSAQIDFV